MEGAEERMSELEDRIRGITQCEQQRQNRLAKNLESLRDIWGYIQQKIYHSFTGVLEGEDKGQG